MAPGAMRWASAPLPWQATQWTRLWASREAGRLPHAILMHGPAGVGKRRFAEALAATLLCQAPGTEGWACGHCQGCRLREAGNHPDLYTVGLLEDKKVIGVDQVRALIEFLTLKAQYGGHKVVLLHPADRLNQNAANSLLKTLEEPPPEAVLLLVAERPSALPATIRSRCQQLGFPLPDGDQALAWLAGQSPDDDPAARLRLAQGAPCQALTLAPAESIKARAAVLDGLADLLGGRVGPVALAAAWLKFDSKQSLYWLYAWCCDMVCLRMAPQARHLHLPDQRERCLRLGGVLELSRLYNMLDRILEITRMENTQANPQLMMERMLVELACGSGPGGRHHGR